MKKWALLTVSLYALILIVLAGPLVLIAFWPKCDAETFVNVYTVTQPWPTVEIEVDGKGVTRVLAGWSLWGWVCVMVLAQVAMLVVPVRIAGERIVSTKWLFWPFLAAFVLLLILAWSMYLAVFETIANTDGIGKWAPIAAFLVVVFMWCLWAIVFGFYTARGDPKTRISRIARSLVGGSILELLVAVPAHVLARSRNYCCAGFGTFWGIAAGVSVMLFAFGPAVFVLFVRRYNSVYRRGSL